MPTATELKVRVPDRAGILGEVAGALAERNISLRAVSAWVEGDEGVIRLVAEPSVAARRELNVLGLDVEELDVVALELDDAPGALAAKAAVLGAAGISITHAFVGTAGPGRAMIYLGVSDLRSALELLDQPPGAPPATPAAGAEAAPRR